MPPRVLKPLSIPGIHTKSNTLWPGQPLSSRVGNMQPSYSPPSAHPIALVFSTEKRSRHEPVSFPPCPSTSHMLSPKATGPPTDHIHPPEPHTRHLAGTLEFPLPLPGPARPTVKKSHRSGAVCPSPDTLPELTGVAMISTMQRGPKPLPRKNCWKVGLTLWQAMHPWPVCTLRSEKCILGQHLAPGGEVLVALCIRDSPEQGLPPKQVLIKNQAPLFFLLKAPRSVSGTVSNLNFPQGQEQALACPLTCPY